MHNMCAIKVGFSSHNVNILRIFVKRFCSLSVTFKESYLERIYKIFKRQCSSTIIIDIAGQGKVKGAYDETAWTNQKFMKFQGIPYAESTGGLSRFKPPLARKPWIDIIDATKPGTPSIPTKEILATKEDVDLEDCFNLCIYTKYLNKKQPVMFYIYGGSFSNLCLNNQQPHFLLEKDIVLVVPNYRVGVLGWITTLTTEMPGNVAIMDILLALGWIQDHVDQFGGDAANVTVFGQSAGAAIACALLLSPKTPKEYFKRAIIQSGSIFAPWAISKSPIQQTLSICKALGFKALKSSEDIHDFLLKVPIEDLLKKSEPELFSITVGDRNGILPTHPEELIMNYDKPIPVMAGFTKHDGSFYLLWLYNSVKKAGGNFSNITVRNFAEKLLQPFHDTTRLNYHLFLRLLFTTDLLRGTDHKKALPSYFDLASMLVMKSPVLALTDHLIQRDKAPIYLYSFDYEGQYSRFGYDMNKKYPFNGGIHHSNENIYLFSTYTLKEKDTQIAKKMIDLWTSFALYGVPSVEEGPVIPAMSCEWGPFFHINMDITIADDVLQELTGTCNDPNSKNLIATDIDF